MKTAEQIVEENFKGLDDLIKDKELVHFYKGVIKECLKRFAEQFIDLAAEQSQEMIYDRQDQQLIESGKGLLLRDFQVCYATPKQSILKLKELIK